MYYKLCWNHQNKSMHNETVQRQRVLDWYHKIKIQVETKKPRQVKFFILRNRLQVERSKMETVL